MSELNPTDEETVRAYRLAFGTPAGQAVLIDLMKFCKFRMPAESQIDEGMRRVFLRIMNLTVLMPVQLQALYAARQYLGEPDDGSAAAE